MKPAWPLLLAAFAACAPAELSLPDDPVLTQRVGLMEQFEAWLAGFRTRLRRPVPATERDCAAEAVFVLRNGQLWDAREMGPSLVDRERLLQVSRWEAMQAAAALPDDLRALAAVAELDELGGDLEGEVAARCRAAVIARTSFDAEVACARSSARAGHRTGAMSAWRSAYPRAADDGQRFRVFAELERLGDGGPLSFAPREAVQRYRAMREWQATPAAKQMELLRDPALYWDRLSPEERQRLLEAARAGASEGKLQEGPDEPLPPRAVVRPGDAEP